MQVVLNVKGSFRTTGSGHNKDVVALYRWPLVLYSDVLSWVLNTNTMCTYDTE